MSRFTQAARRGEGWLQTRVAGWLLLVLVGVWYGWAYAHHPLNPGEIPTEQRAGWWSWSDQYKYLRSAQTLAAGQVTPETYHYPLGYAALAAPFVRWLPVHPFFVPNLLLMLATAACWWQLARRWLPATVALFVAIVFIITHHELIGLTMVVPWNTLVTQLCLVAGLGLVSATPNRRIVWLLAALAAAAWWVRPIDALCLAPLLVVATLRLPTWRERTEAGFVGIAIIGAAAVAVGLLNRAVFGTWRTPYEQAAFTMVGFFDYPLGQKLYWTFVDGRPFFGETDTALLPRYPWLFLAIPGLFFWVKREGWAGVAGVATVGLSWLLYLGYNDFFPSSFYRFSLIHYVSWSFLPLLAVAAAACWAGSKDRVVWGGAVAMLGVGVLAWGGRLEERELPALVKPGEVTALPLVRPLWVRFPEAPLTEVGKLRLDERAMIEAADYQIPYVPSDLKLLLGRHARGTRLAAPGISATPQVGDYRWSWRWEWFRGSPQAQAAAPRFGIGTSSVAASAR